MSLAMLSGIILLLPSPLADGTILRHKSESEYLTERMRICSILR